MLFALDRFRKDDGYGVVFTNSTGTGKTFSAMGIAKILSKQGKNNILVIVPNAEVMGGWLKAGPMLGLPITKLRDTKDHGTGVVVTTYANVQNNDALVKRKWDMVFADESQNLSANAGGDSTGALDMVRALTMHPDGVSRRTQALHPELHERIQELWAKYRELERKKDTAAMRKIADKLAPLQREFGDREREVRETVEAAQGKDRPRLTMLSATPFAYAESVRPAQGYLFDWENREHGFDPDGRGSAYTQFMVRHFGYRIRYGKLTKPDPRKVDVGMMERQFNTWLRREGVLSGRTLDVDADYDRKFIAAHSDVGSRIDSALRWFWDVEPESLGDLPLNEESVATPEQQVRAALGNVQRALQSKFDYRTKLRLLEALKAEALVPYIQQNLDMGRKVVVFHDLIKGQVLDPFTLHFDDEKQQLEQAIWDKWKAQFPDLAEFDFKALKTPIETMSEAFGDKAKMLNGQTVTKREAAANLAALNDDERGPMVLVVQSDKEAGWSGHDTTGAYPRVIVNLGLPVRPTRSIQQEGRIYRVGQVSNAMFRYANTQTAWEQQAFAQTMARRASTAENLAMGEQARGLLDAYIEAFEDTGEWPPGFEGEGTGGKERDRQMASIISEYDRAKTLYYAQLAKRKQDKGQEGVDYFATPEPLGLKMVQWADIRPGESSMEPSAGHGAIARWIPDAPELGINRLAIEPSPRLSAKLALAFDGNVRQMRFEDLHTVNKADTIVMNPPFGVGGKTAVEHLDKAYNEHLNPGGRIVILLPTGPAADARFEKWINGTTERKATQPLGHTERAGDFYAGDTVELDGREGRYRIEGRGDNGMVMVRRVDGNGGIPEGYRSHYIVRVSKEGPRTEETPNAPDAQVVGTIALPRSTFERAGTEVPTRIVIIDKPAKGQEPAETFSQDFSRVESNDELFDALEHFEVPERTKPRPADDEEAAPAPVRADPAEPLPNGEKMAEEAGLEPFDYTTRKGKVLRVVEAPHLTREQAEEIEGMAWKPAGKEGWYIKVKNVPAMLAKYPPPAPLRDIARTPRSAQPSDPFYSALKRQIDAIPMKAGDAQAWKQAITGLVNKGLVKQDEVEWSGLPDWLDLQQGKVTREAVSEFLRNNGVKVTETVLGKWRAKPLPPGWSVDTNPDDEYGGAAILNERGDVVGYGDDAAEAYLNAGLVDGGVHGSPKYSQYVLPGGSNYREILLTLPETTPDYVVRDRDDGGVESVAPDGSTRWWPNRAAAEAWVSTNGAQERIGRGQYRSNHWEQPNVLAHIRVNDRTDADGNRVLFVEELQSDWGSEGKEKGFDSATLAALKAEKQSLYDSVMSPDAPGEPTREQRARWSQLQDLILSGERSPGVPAAPFVGNTEKWLTLALKRVVKLAVDEGYARVAFVNGEQSAERYDLSKRVRSVEWQTVPLSKKGTNSQPPTHGRLIAEGVRGGTVIDQDNIAAADLADYVGKEVAQRLLDMPVNGQTKFREVRRLEGLDLKVGGEGMRAFYDQIVPAALKKLLPKVGGGRIGDVWLRDQTNSLANDSAAHAGAIGASPQPGFTITPEMRAKAAGGMPLFSRSSAERRGVGAIGRMGYERQTPERIQAGRQLAGLIKRLDAGEITPAYFEASVRSLARRMDDVVTVKAANKIMAGRERGADLVREKLIAARRRSDLDNETVELALWLLDRNPALADDLAVSIRKAGENHDGSTVGTYNPVSRTMRLFKGLISEDTAAHELLHHTERMMPEDMQAAIRREWAAALAKAVKGATPEQLQALEHIAPAMAGDAAAFRDLSKAFSDGVLDYDAHYQLVNPSEFWAVNATRILRGAFDAKGSVWARIKQWVRDLFEKIKGLVGANSEAPVRRAIDYLMDERNFGAERGGAFLSGSMLREGAQVAHDIARKPKEEAKPAETPAPKLKASTAPLDRASRLAAGKVGKVTAPLYDSILTRADTAMSAVGGDLWEYVKAGTVDRYGLSEEHIRADQERGISIKKMLRSSVELVDKLRALTPQESRVAYLWMSDKSEEAAFAHELFNELPEESRALLESVQEDIEFLSDQAVEYGLLSPETRERNRMAYMHRSYQKFLDDERTAEIRRQRAVAIIGDTFKHRGMGDYAPMEKVGSDDWWQRKTNGSAHDPSLKGKKFYRLERRSTPDDATPQMFDDENGKRMGRLKERIYWPVDEAIPRQYADWRNDGVWEARFFNKSDTVGMWRDYTLAERTRMGEIQEVKYALAVTLNQMQRDVATAKFLDWIARNESVVDESQIPEGHTPLEGASTSLTRSYLKNEWVKVPDTRIQGTGLQRFGKLAGRWVPGPVWNDIRQTVEMNDRRVMAKVWAETMKAWKVSKTALSPVTHTNNVMSNFLLADLHDIQSRHIYKALLAWSTHGKNPAMKQLIDDYRDNGGDAGKFTDGEIRQELFGPLLEELRKQLEGEAGVTANIAAAQVIDLLQHRQFRQAIAAAGDSRMAAGPKFVVKKLMKLYGHEDELFRLAAFIKAREDGLSDHDAGQFARDSFLNYDIRAPWINAMRKSFFPFFSFSYRAVPMLARIAAEKPYKALKYHILSAMLTGISFGMRAGLAYMTYGLLTGGDDDDKDIKREQRERAWMTDEQSGKIWGFMTPKLWRVPFDDRFGSPMFLDVRRWVPGGDVVDMGQSHSVIPLPPALTPGGPAWMPAEFILNMSGFTGKPLLDTPNPTAMERAEATGKYLWRSMMPNFPAIPGTYSWDAIKDAIAGKVNPGPHGQEATSVPQALLGSVGIKVRSYPTEALKFNAEIKARAERRQIINDVRKAEGQMRRHGMSLEDYAEKEREAKAKLDEITRDWEEREAMGR